MSFFQAAREQWDFVAYLFFIAKAMRSKNKKFVIMNLAENTIHM